MKISAIIPTHNNESTIEKCILSLKRQTIKPAEIIIIDSNSSDKTRQIAKKLGCKIHNIKSNRSRARNIGAEKSRHNILAFIESDSIYEKNWSRYVLEEFKRGAEAVLDRRQVHNPKTLVAKINDEIFRLRYKKYRPISMWIIKKDLFSMLGGFDEELEAAEDIDFGDRLIKSKHTIAFAKKAIQYHLGEPKTLKETLQRAWWFGRNMPPYYKKHSEKIPYRRIILLTALNISMLMPETFLVLLTLTYAAIAIKSLRLGLNLRYSITHAGLSILREESFYLASMSTILSKKRII